MNHNKLPHDPTQPHDNVYRIPRTLENDFRHARNVIVDGAKDIFRSHEDAAYPRAQKVIRKIGLTALAALPAVGIVLGGAAEHGNNDPERYSDNLDPAITEVIIHEGANIRYDPYVERTEGGNVAVVADEHLQLPTDGAYILDRHHEGDTWIGVDAAIIENATNTMIRDADGTVWINNQKASTVQGEQPDAK